jgi:hypothetical protein
VLVAEYGLCLELDGKIAASRVTRSTRRSA